MTKLMFLISLIVSLLTAFSWTSLKSSTEPEVYVEETGENKNCVNQPSDGSVNKERGQVLFSQHRKQKNKK